MIYLYKAKVNYYDAKHIDAKFACEMALGGVYLKYGIKLKRNPFNIRVISRRQMLIFNMLILSRVIYYGLADCISRVARKNIRILILKLKNVSGRFENRRVL
jgi:hypothetical protein